MKEAKTKKIIVTTSLIFATLFFSFAPYLYAVEDQFQVSQLVTDAPAASTTPPTTGGSTSGGGGGSGPQSNLIISNFLVQPGLTDVRIRFETNLQVLATTYWGLSTNYGIGTLEGTQFLKNTDIKLERLLPDTKYHFKIGLIDEFGRFSLIDNQEFTTLPLLTPENVSNLKATPDEKVITLTWKNPLTNFESVRILKSDKFYPRDPFDGKVIYEGVGEKFIDTEVVADTRYYYTAFSKNKFGNYSSGAVADAMLLKPGEQVTIRDLFGGVLLLPEELIHPLIKELSLLDVDFIQDGVKLPVINDIVDIRGDRSLIISIDYHKVPEILKTITVTLRDPVDAEKSFSFLLRVNKDKTAYEAHIAAFDRPGRYSFGIAILDYKNQGLKKLAGALVATVPNLVLKKGDNLFDKFPNSYLFLLLVLLLLILIILLIFRRRKDLDSFDPPYMATQSKN